MTELIVMLIVMLIPIFLTLPVINEFAELKDRNAIKLIIFTYKFHLNESVDFLCIQKLFLYII